MQSATSRKQETSKSALSDLRDAFNEVRVRYGAKALCETGGWKHEASITQITDGTARMGMIEKVLDLAVNLCDEHDDPTMARVFVGSRFCVVPNVKAAPNGTLDDDFCESVDALSDLRRLFSDPTTTDYDLLSRWDDAYRELMEMHHEIDQRIRRRQPQMFGFAA